MAEEKKVPNLKAKYQQEVAPALMQKFGYKSTMQIPKLDKIVVNCGCGEARDNSKVLEAVVSDLTTITGQKAIITKAKTYLRELESGATELAAPAHAAQDAAQMTLGDAAGDEIAEQLRSIDLNTITPLEAMRLLFELQQKARG